MAGDGRAVTAARRLCGPAASVLCVLVLAACDQAAAPATQRVVGGEPEAGRAILAGNRYGCAACHIVPGVRGPRGTVGPSLEHFGSRAYVAGRIPNTPGNLVRWIMSPQRIDPETAMPDTGIGEEEARHIAAYLYTLR